MVNIEDLVLKSSQDTINGNQVTIILRNATSWDYCFFDGIMRLKSKEDSPVVEVSYGSRRFTLIILVLTEILTLLGIQETCTKRAI
ncbi:hypothetical protein CBL_02880 [Carabus blaptoides fortunei]